MAESLADDDSLQPRLYLSDFRIKLGTIVALADLDDPDIADNRRSLLGAGVDSVSVIEGTPEASAAELLRSAPEPGQSGGIIYVTENLRDTSSGGAIGTLLHLSGRENSPTFIATGNGCANFGFAVLSAVGPCQAFGPLTIVAADVAPPGTRVLTDSMSILGDGTGMCTVSPERSPGPSFEVVAVRTTARMAPPGPRPATAGLQAMIDGLGEATRAALAAADWTADEPAGMLVGAYSRGSRRFLAHASRISRQFVPETSAGHCFSVDILRGLTELTTSDTLADGTPILALASGRFAWSVLALRYHRH